MYGVLKWHSYIFLTLTPYRLDLNFLGLSWLLCIFNKKKIFLKIVVHYILGENFLSSEIHLQIAYSVNIKGKESQKDINRERIPMCLTVISVSTEKHWETNEASQAWRFTSSLPGSWDQSQQNFLLGNATTCWGDACKWRTKFPLWGH
jgi:hypothetical protein